VQSRRRCRFLLTSGTPEALWQSYLQLARVLRASAQTSEAIFFGKQAVAKIEQERRSLVGAERRYETGFLRDKWRLTVAWPTGSWNPAGWMKASRCCS
jgi:hypothetical protein